jgi:hypothetical protein
VRLRRDAPRGSACNFTPISPEPPLHFALVRYSSPQEMPMEDSKQRPWPAELSRRAAACVRACDGIPTDRLEAGVIVRLVAACVHVADDRLREILEELVPPRGARSGAAILARGVSAEETAAANG